MFRPDFPGERRGPRHRFTPRDGRLAMDRRILVVDDSELVCQQLSQFLPAPGAGSRWPTTVRPPWNGWSSGISRSC